MPLLLSLIWILSGCALEPLTDSALPMASAPQARLVTPEDADLTASDYDYFSQFGSAVDGAGDLDGDGYADIAVGAPYHDYGSKSWAGAAYVYYGSATGIVAATEEQLLAPSPGATDYFGWEIAGAGDVDGDGYDDLLIGARGDNVAYVFYGATAGLGTPDSVTISGTTYLGDAVAGAGDVDGDGLADLVLGDYAESSYAGVAYVLHGTSTGVDATSYTTVSPANIESGAQYGAEVDGAGDVNGDGYADIIGAAELDDNANGANAGSAYVSYGTATGIESSSETELLASDGWINDYYGSSVAGVGDVDGDGFDDVAVGESSSDDRKSNGGEVYLYYGTSTGVDLSTERQLYTSVASSNHFYGESLSAAGDVDGDGYDDILVGSLGDYAHVLFGHPDRVDVSAQDNVQGSNTSSGDNFGYAVGNAGDVDGDGFDDVVVGANYYDISSTWEGAAYVFHGETTDDDADGIVASSDCDDDDATVGEKSTFYADVDEDGYGDADADDTLCPGTSGYVDNDEDCDDGDADIHPEADELCDGVDNDCDEDVDEDDATDASTWYVDADGDGFGGTGTTTACDVPSGYVDNDADCDDTDSAIQPDADEVCDSVDNDCDGDTDEVGATDAATWYYDADADGYGEPGTSEVACDAPSGFVADDQDCDDEDDSVHPGAEETCDEQDQDCDEVTDEDAVDASTFYADSDGDAYGDEATTTTACDVPSGYAAIARDCDDADASVSPAADEWCDDIDNDCDETVDEDGAVDTTNFYADVDGDGYGDNDTLTEACAAASGFVAQAGDCDDGAASTYPGADEYCDAVDNDCDDLTDEAGALDESTFYADADRDGYGDEDSTEQACSASAGFVVDATDCDDEDAAIWPGAPESCDGIDSDCDGEDGVDCDVVEEEPPSGCDCATGSTVPPPVLLGLLSLVFVRRRRHGHARRHGGQ